MCHWIGSHFHDWIDHNGVASSIRLLSYLNGVAHFRNLWWLEYSGKWGFKNGKICS